MANASSVDREAVKGDCDRFTTAHTCGEARFGTNNVSYVTKYCAALHVSSLTYKNVARRGQRYQNRNGFSGREAYGISMKRCLFT